MFRARFIGSGGGPDDMFKRTCPENAPRQIGTGATLQIKHEEEKKNDVGYFKLLHCIKPQKLLKSTVINIRW